MGDYGALGGKAFGVSGFFFEEGKGDQQGEVGVLVSGGFELHIELLLDEFPDTVSPRFDDHAAACFRVFSHVGSADDLLIPLGEVVASGGLNCRWHGITMNTRKKVSIFRSFFWSI